MRWLLVDTGHICHDIMINVLYTAYSDIQHLSKRIVSSCSPTITSAHEYTASNAKFALSVEPGNEELVARAKEIMEMRERGEPTVPSTIGEEKRTNPFVRVDISEEIRKNVGVTSDDTDDDAFAKVRSAKDNFRG